MSAELPRPLRAQPFVTFVIMKYKKDAYTLDIMREIAQGITGGKYPTFNEWTTKDKPAPNKNSKDMVLDIINKFKGGV